MLIRKLELNLENCDVVTIDGKYIGHFHAGDIRKSISRMGCNWIDVQEICHEFCIEIHPDANKMMHEFGCEEFAVLTFDRLSQHSDITSITIYLYDQYDKAARNDESKDTVYHYFVHWDGGDYKNSLQASKISKPGWLYITIGKELNLEEIFPALDVDDEESADSRAQMLNIGNEYWEEHQKQLSQTDDLDTE